MWGHCKTVVTIKNQLHLHWEKASTNIIVPPNSAVKLCDRSGWIFCNNVIFVITKVNFWTKKSLKCHPFIPISGLEVASRLLFCSWFLIVITVLLWPSHWPSQPMDLITNKHYQHDKAEWMTCTTSITCTCVLVLQHLHELITSGRMHSGVV